MKSKFLRKFFTFLTTCSIFLMKVLKAEEIADEDKAFYAISSLKFYLKDHLSDSFKNTNKAETIHFHQSDIAYLWFCANSRKSISSRIGEAQSYYDESLNPLIDQALSIELCEKAHHILEDIWQDLNPYSIKEEHVTGQEWMTRSYYPHFDDNPLITSAIRKQMRPYLLPLDHPLKASLDHLFHAHRVIQNVSSFAASGFITLFHQPYSKIRVARHPDLPGYLVKVYLDSDPYIINHHACWKRLMNRCIGAKNIRHLIRKKKLMHFSVPDKWLYPLPIPDSLLKKPKSSLQPVILVVTDMDLVSQHESTEAWRNLITHRHLDELYCLLSHGFASPYLSINIPYSKSGKFTCVDTEDPQKEFNLNIVRKFLSPEMQNYWDELVRTGGKI